MLLLGHIFDQLLFRVFNFLYRWYVGSFLRIYHVSISLLEALDRSIALRVSAKHLFVPMFGDKTVSGYILGFIFRFLRIVIGVVAYLAIILVSLAIYIAWAAFPILVISWGIYG